MTRVNRNRYNQYRIMWIYVFFDLPTQTKNQVRIAGRFRKFLINDGFKMFQFSIYIRQCTSRENAKVHERRVKKKLPPKGKVGILLVTDKQFGMMEIFYGPTQIPLPPSVTQLELF